MAPGVEIRNARIEDWADLLRLYAQLRPGGDLPDRALAMDRLREMLSSPTLSLSVAELDGRVVGTVALMIAVNLTHGGRPWAQVENMVVDESLRGTGVGRALLDSCKAAANAAGCYKLQLQSANQRDGAHRFYDANGFLASSQGFRLYLE